MAALALTAAAVGLSAFGAYQSYQGARDQADAQKQFSTQQAEAERRAEKLRKRQMELEAQRRQREVVRNQQRARAMALATATNQGAVGGSGLQGGYGQISGDAGNQLLATSQNLQIGQGLFNVNQELTGYRMAYGTAMADSGTQIALGRGLSSLGSSIMSVTPQLTAMSRGFGGAPPQAYMGPAGSNPYMIANRGYWG